MFIEQIGMGFKGSWFIFSKEMPLLKEKERSWSYSKTPQNCQMETKGYTTESRARLWINV